jgi:hypothetical protein
MTQTNRVLTLQTLVQKGVCPSQRKLFQELFGSSVNITPELCAGVANRFDWEWAAEYLLSAKADAAYQAATAKAWAAYTAATAKAWAAYTAATAKARAAFDAAIAPAWAEYRAAIAPAWAEAYINDWEA